MTKTSAVLLILGALFSGISFAEIREVRQPPRYEWKKFVKVAGQPNEVPAEWVSTPEGQFAHSIVIPNPVPADSGYRPWWSAKQYHKHLCETEAGEFVFKTVDNVDGLLFMRPPNRPTDYELKDSRKLEAPSFERGFGALGIKKRGRVFVWNGGYNYVEEPAPSSEQRSSAYLLASSPSDSAPFELREVTALPFAKSRYGVTWRGIIRIHDRENAISGYEVLIIDIQTNEILGVLRDFGLTGFSRQSRDGIWWLNSKRCSQFSGKYKAAGTEHLVDFVKSVIRPSRLPF